MRRLIISMKISSVYVVALSFIAVILLVSQLLLRHSIDRQRSDGHLINEAGRQRMLSQQMVKIALMLQFDSLPEKKSAHVSKLHSIYDKWTKDHQLLSTGTLISRGNKNLNSQEIQEKFKMLTHSFEPMQLAARRVMDVAGKPTSERELHNQVNMLLKYEPAYLESMDRIVDMYVDEAEARVVQLEQVESWLFILSILMLMAEGVFIFRPAFNRIHKHILQLQNERRRVLSILEGTDAGTWECHVRTGEAVINERWAAMLGYQYKELMPFSRHLWEKLIHPEDLPAANARLKDCQEGTTMFYESECRFRHKNGSWIWVLEKGKVVNWGVRGQALIMSGTSLDITARKQTEELLKISEQTFRSSFENSAIGVALVSESGQWLKVNQRIPEMLGYTPEELLQLSFQDVTHTEDVENDVENLKRLVAGAIDTYKLEKRYYHKSGRIVYAIIAVSVVRDSTGKLLHFVTQILDITDTRQLALEKKHNQQLLNGLYDHSPIGIILNDFETGRFIKANDKAIEALGYTNEEILNLTYWDVTPEEYYNEIQEISLSLEKNGVYGPVEKEFVRKDGSRYPVMLRGALIIGPHGRQKIWSFAEDITLKKANEKKLLGALGKLQAIYEASTQIGVIATNLNGTITAFNTGAEKLFGYSAVEMIGNKTPNILFKTDDISFASARAFLEYGEDYKGFHPFIAKAKRGEVHSAEYELVRKDGILIPVLLCVSPIFEREKLTGYLVVSTDTSLLKEAESEVKALLKITQEQNDRLKNFAHIVSHNLRSHSGGIASLVDLIQKEEPDLTGNEIFRYIADASKSLQETIDHLTEVVEINLQTKQTISKIPLQPVIENSIKSMLPLARKANVQIINEVETRASVRGVAAYLDSVIQNFITNAIKYKSDERESFVKITTEIDDHHIVVNFIDNGLGIDLEKQGHKLFGMYKTFHQHKDARGIGLFITKNQVEAMNGRIAVASEVNVGSRFSVYFPYEKN